MLDVSSHTHQINLWISLSTPQTTYSDTLVSSGYECDVIEDQMYIYDDDDTEIIHPDVVLTDSTERDHSLVVDCKSNSIDADQIRRYLRLDEFEDQLITQGLVSDISTTDLTSEAVLSSFDDLSTHDIPDEIAIVHFENNPYGSFLISNPSPHDFDDDRLNRALPINVSPSQPLPTGLYPFDIYEADKEALVASILSSILSLSIQEGEFSIEDILDRSHPYWDKLGDDKKDELYRRVEIVYYELLNLGLDEYLEKVAGTQGSKWRQTSATIQAVQDRTDYYVNRVLDNLPQARLDSNAWSTDVDEGEAE